MKRRSAPLPLPPPEKTLPLLAFSLEEAGEIISVGRSTMYELVKEGRIIPVKISERKQVISLAELHRFLGTPQDPGSQRPDGIT
jgi:excisionase family DNA binding protein